MLIMLIIIIIIIITNDIFITYSSCHKQSFKDRLQKLLSICKQGHDKQIQLQIIRYFEQMGL